MMSRRLLGLIAAFGCVVGATAAVQEAEPSSPFLSGAIPLAGETFGEARLNVAQTGSGTTVTLVGGESSDFGRGILNPVRNWRLRAGQPPIRLDVRVREREGDRCTADFNPLVEIRYPTSIDILRRGYRICEDFHPAGRVVTRPPLHGKTVDQAGQPVTGVLIRLWNRSERTVRHVQSDERGVFIANNLPSGTYDADFSHSVQATRSFELVVDSDAPRGDWEVVMPRNRVLAEMPSVVVTAADLPQYPDAAQSAATSGTVEIRVSIRERSPGSSTYDVVDIDAVGTDPILVQAARDNVSTWRFANVRAPVLRITYDFRILPGDCGPNQGVWATMRFPHGVELIAKRRIRCQGP